MAVSFLITGATGNVGQAVVNSLQVTNGDRLFKATHHATTQSPDERYLDFQKPDTFQNALAGINRVFLLRPPQLANVDVYFKPFITACSQAKIDHIVFLSVQGADKLSFIPHAKIENLIRQSGIQYTFMRPSYFMQNLTAAFGDDIRLHHQLFIPAGRAKFLWVDAVDVGRAAAVVLQQTERHRNQAYDLTGVDLIDFEDVSAMLSEVLGFHVQYESPNVFRYYWKKRRQGLSNGQVLVMLLLHVLPRFQSTPSVSDNYHLLTGQNPTTLLDFIRQQKSSWLY